MEKEKTPAGYVHTRYSYETTAGLLLDQVQSWGMCERAGMSSSSVVRSALRICIQRFVVSHSPAEDYCNNITALLGREGEGNGYFNGPVRPPMNAGSLLYTSKYTSTSVDSTAMLSYAMLITLPRFRRSVGYKKSWDVGIR